MEGSQGVLWLNHDTKEIVMSAKSSVV